LTYHGYFDSYHLHKIARTSERIFWHKWLIDQKAEENKETEKQNAQMKQAASKARRR